MAKKSVRYVAGIAVSCMLGMLIATLSGCGCGCSCCSHKDKFVSEKKAAEHTAHHTAHNKSSCGCGSASCGHKVDKTDKGNEMAESAKQKSETGLEWEVIQEGAGDTPKAGQTVVVHYTGWLNENGQPGKKFDSSVDRGQKFSFIIGVGQVIKGWDEGVLSMKKGEKRFLYIPAELAYGQRGAGGVIPPNADLIFEVELFDMS